MLGKSFLVERYPLSDPRHTSFFRWLSSLNEHAHGQTKLFDGRIVCGYAHYDALVTYPDDRCYSIEATPAIPSTLMHFATSGAERVFAAVLYDRNKAILFEIDWLQLLILPKGVRTESGQVYTPRMHPIIVAPGDGAPLLQAKHDKASGTYLGFREADVPADPTVKKPTAADGQEAPASKPLKRLVFDVGHPSLTQARVNMDAVLLSLLE
jgi:hypothetical protein